MTDPRGRVRLNLSLSGQVSIGAKHSFAQWLDVPDLGGGSLSLCLSAEALVHVAEATSIVAEATTLISIYTSECHLLALTDGYALAVGLRSTLASAGTPGSDGIVP